MKETRFLMTSFLSFFALVLTLIDIQINEFLGQIWILTKIRQKKRINPRIADSCFFSDLELEILAIFLGLFVNKKF